MKKSAVLTIIFMLAINSAQAAFAADIPNVDAAAAVLMDFETGRVLWEKDSRKPMAMASTTKIMTAILALENGNLSDIVTVSRRASLAPKVKMNLREGEKITLEALLHALLLESANDAAVAVAEHIGGTVEGFCLRMTEKARELGAEDTVFETPNGLDSQNHHSTARDMAQITRYALRNEAFVRIIGTPYASYSSDKKTYGITNKDRFLNEFDGAIGVKTGYTGKAGYCFVGAAKRDDLQLISVVLASGWGSRGREQKWVDTKRIMSYGFANFSVTPIVEANGAAGEFAVTHSKTDLMEAYFAEGFSLPLAEGEKAAIRVETRLQAVKAPVEAGQTIGQASVLLNGEEYAKIPLKALQGAARFDLKTSFDAALNGFLGIGRNGGSNTEFPESWFD